MAMAGMLLFPPTGQFKFSNCNVSFVCPCLGSDGLGTRLDPMKTEDSALSEPLGSSGDCTWTHFRPIFGWGDKHDRMAMLVGPLLMERPHVEERLQYEKALI